MYQVLFPIQYVDIFLYAIWYMPKNKKPNTSKVKPLVIRSYTV